MVALIAENGKTAAGGWAWGLNHDSGEPIFPRASTAPGDVLR